MSGNNKTREKAAWCSECKRLFEAFANADFLRENLISNIESATLPAEIERLEISADDARRKCQNAKENFVAHRSRHTYVDDNASTTVLALR